MGAWNYGIFDDDTAYDFIDEIRTTPLSFFKTSFDTAIKAEYLEYDECHAVTVSAAYIDSLLNNTDYSTEGDYEEYNVNNFRIIQKDLNVEPLRPLAVKGLQKVLSEHSELNELWSENEELYPKWKQTLLDLIERLSKTS